MRVFSLYFFLPSSEHFFETLFQVCMGRQPCMCGVYMFLVEEFRCLHSLWQVNLSHHISKALIKFYVSTARNVVVFEMFLMSPFYYLARKKIDFFEMSRLSELGLENRSSDFCDLQLMDFV